MSTFKKDCKRRKTSCKDDDKKMDIEECKVSKNRKAKSIILSCGTGNSVDFDAAGNLNEAVIPSPSSAVVGQVSIDLPETCMSTVEIEFSSIISFVASTQDARGALIFRLYRACGDEDPVIVNTWTYEVLEIEDVNTITLSNTFGFTFCECLKDAGCCSYFVEASVGDLINIQTLSVNNVQISAIAQ